MEAEMTINGFNLYLGADEEESLIQSVLRQLTQIAQPEEVRSLLARPASVWSGWAY